MKSLRLRPGLALTLALACAGMLAHPSVAEAAPPQGMPDPSQMSGIPRADPNLPPEVVTVRCLDGGFDKPMLGVTVELELRAPNGTTETLSLASGEAGRARFEGLGDHFGHSVVAKATFAGQTLTSQTFTLDGQSGYALMLVARGGSSAPPPGGDPHGGSQGDVPLPGKPFPLPNKPRGSLIVGALDLAGSGAAMPGVEITLTATPPAAPDGAVVEPIVLTGKTDAEGRVVFEQLDTTLPEGASLVVTADLGDGLERSEAFTLGATGYAIVLTKNEGKSAPPGPAPTPERQIFPPRSDRSLAPGKLRVIVIDAADRPVANQPVFGLVNGITGDSQSIGGTTDAGGQIVLDFVPAHDQLAEISTEYGGAPWTSGGFSMPDDSGAVVVLRVFPTTADRSIARSAIQVDVMGRENDLAAVTFMIAVFIEGDVAYWPGGGMRIWGPNGTRFLQVLPEAEEWLKHDEEAPYVDLAKPLPPGVEIRLSFAVTVPHEGKLELDWTTPFPLVENASLVTVPSDLEVTHGVAGAPETNPHAGRDGGPLDIYQLGHRRFEPGVCDRLGSSGAHCPFSAQLGNDLEIVVEGLPRRSRVWPWTAWALLGVTGLGLVVGLGLRPRVGVRGALLARRDALLAELVALEQTKLPAAEREAERARLLAALDGIYRRLEGIGPR